jgi:hypothetical protein
VTDQGNHLMSNRILALSLTAAASVGAALAATPAALGAGGLSLSPAVVEHAAKAGAVGTVTVNNSSAVPLKVTVTPRPWKQAPSGAVAPDKGKSLLSKVAVSARSFTLAAGARKAIALTLKAKPAGGSLYGAVDVVGLPTEATKKRANGVVTGYRLIGSLRLTPAAPRLRLRAGAVTARGGRLVLAVTNTGNTIDPVSGSIRLTGAAGGRTIGVAAQKVLPGATVELPLGSAKGLPKGRWTAKATLVQGGRTVLRASKAFTLK